MKSTSDQSDAGCMICRLAVQAADVASTTPALHLDLFFLMNFDGQIEGKKYYSGKSIKNDQIEIRKYEKLAPFQLRVSPFKFDYSTNNHISNRGRSETIVYS